MFRSFHICFGKIDFIDDGNNFQIVIQGQIHVAHGLRFDALRSIHQQQRSIAGSQAARYFIRKIYMTGSVDQIKNILFSTTFMFHFDGMRFDRDATFTLQIHIIQNLSYASAFIDHMGGFQQPVG